MTKQNNVVSRWAIISDDIVTNIVEWDGCNGAVIFPDAAFYKVKDSDVVGVGYSCALISDGEYKFTPPDDYNTVY